ncbi:putative Histidine kinase [Candidatus Zixiibacteriota bacterium]|nr:putative Histidine kinase [candidate division Zixibacteria bacterium]
MNMNITSDGVDISRHSSEHERKVLALESLSKLASQFARDPDLQKLIDSLALTIAGQFGVTSTLIAIRTNESESFGLLKAATGKFRNLSEGFEPFNLILNMPTLMTDPGPFRMGDADFPFGKESALYIEMERMEARLFAPMVVDRRNIGLILLGPRIGKVDYKDSEVMLLRDLVTTITPLIANSLLYAEMSQLKTRYLSIIDSVPQAMFVFDSREILRTANKTAVDLIASLGGTMYDETPVGLAMETIFPEANFPDWVERLRSAGGENDDKLHTTVIIRSDDHERIFNVRASTFISQPGADSEKILTLQDITDQKENERRMFEQEKFAEQGMMASAIAHELNNFLGVIQGGTELALLNMERGRPEKAAATMQKLMDNIGAMQRFTAGLTDFARVNVQMVPGNINDVVTDVLSFVVSQKRFSRISVRTQLTRQLPDIVMDRDQIAQVVINILNNAADAIAETGRSDGIIIVGTTFDQGSIGLTISDNGKGMKPEVRDRIFKTHLTTKPKGHGYGLVNCGKIIERHGASVEITSQIGFGTTFALKFPTDKPPSW